MFTNTFFCQSLKIYNSNNIYLLLKKDGSWVHKMEKNFSQRGSVSEGLSCEVKEMGKGQRGYSEGSDNPKPFKKRGIPKLFKNQAALQSEFHFLLQFY